MKNKGFTLIELLSVIVILAVITLIAVPVISGVITKVRLNALKSSAYGLLDATNLYHAQYTNTKSVRFNISDNNVTSNDTINLLTYSGEIKEGTVIINKKGETTLCITDGKNSVYKNYKDEKVIEAANKKCTIPSSTYVVYLDDQATLSELSNEELTELVRSMQEEMDEMRTELNSKASQSDLDVVSTVAGSATLDKTYPVGSIYVSVNSTSPATLFGGTWERVKDSFLLASGDTYTAGTTGGSATNSHTHSVTAAGTVGGHTLTTSEIPSHRHSIPALSGTAASAGSHSHSIYGGLSRANGSNYGGVDGAPFHGDLLVNQSVTTTTLGAFSALSAGAHTHSVTTTANNTGYLGDSGSHNHSFTGTAVTSGAASDTNNMPPYLSVYVWKRTA